ncbi:MAG TPA: hypothetical protein VK155_02460 [Bacteroidales bacterium]|nr:hypothetical protein [Bacteroidales bacterium]
MRNRIKLLVIAGMLVTCLPFISNGQMKSAAVESSGAMIKENYTGDWKFEAPDAPPGSTSGSLVMKPDAIIMSFDDIEEYPSSWIQVRNDSIIYQVKFDQATVVFSLKIIDKENMSGKAVWEDGETDVILRKRIVGVRT